MIQNIKRLVALIARTPLIHKECSHSQFPLINQWQVKRFISSDRNVNNDESTVHRGWKKFSIAIKTFMAGSKALYKDVKVMYEIQSIHGVYSLTSTAPQKVEHGKTTFPLSRSQLQFSFKVSNMVYHPSLR